MIRHVSASFVAFAAALSLGVFSAALAENQQPYAGQETRDIAALSPAEVAGLKAGAGLGYALAAELNGYPGPAHVLELAGELALSDGQVAAVTDIRDRMRSAAIALGEERIAAENALDMALKSQSVDAGSLSELVARAGQIDARLREVHLAAHLEVTPLLTRHQIMIYSKLRGYGTGAGGHGSHGSHGQH